MKKLGSYAKMCENYKYCLEVVNKTTAPRVFTISLKRNNLIQNVLKQGGRGWGPRKVVYCVQICIDIFISRILNFDTHKEES